MSAEIERVLANMIRIGVIAELDEANARVKVSANGLTTDWLPWSTGRAGATRTWSAPRPGEQVMVLAPHGDTGQAVVMPSIYQDNHPAPAVSQDQEHIEFPDGSTVDYNSATNTFTMNLEGEAKVIVNCKTVTVNCETAAINADTSVTIDTPITTCTGDLTVDGHIHFGEGMDGIGLITNTGAVISGGDHLAAYGTSLLGHTHMELGDGQPTSSPN